MKTRVLSSGFNTGEVTPEMFGRVDLQKVRNACALARNMIVLPHGPVENRTGFAYVNEVKNSANFTRLVPFVFSQTQTFAIELGAGYFRFHTEGATLLSGGAPYEVANSYAAADLAAIKFTQSNDVMTFVHPSYPVMELKRLGATNWTFTPATFGASIAAPTALAGTANEPVTTNAHPLPRQYVVTALAPNTLEESLPSGSVSLTNDLTLAGNTNSLTWTPTPGAVAQNVYANISPGGVYGFVGQVAGSTGNFTDNNITPDFTQTPPTGNYNTLGTAGGYPAATTYYQQRRVFGGADNSPQTVMTTRSGTEYNLNYSIPVRSDDAIQFTVASREENSIKHILPLRTDLILLTPDAEYQVTGSGNVITPSNLSITPFTYIGAGDAPPQGAGNSVVYAASRGGRVRELIYQWQAQGYISNDLCLLAPHLFDGYNVIDMAFCKALYPIIWCINDQGSLLGLTYVPEQQVAAWHHHDTDGDKFEACCSVIEGSYDVLYVIVNRTINGATRRFVERLVPRQFATQAAAFFVDSGVTYQAPNGSYSQSGATVTCTTTTAHNLTTGQSVALSFSNAALSGNYTVTVVNSTTFTVTVATSATATGTVQIQVTTVSGLTWLEGRTVNVLTDGATHPQVVVSATGTITLNWPAGICQIGLPITAQFQGMPFAFFVTWDDRGYGRAKNVNRAFLRVHNSSSFYAGPNFNSLVQYAMTPSGQWGEPPPWITDEVEIVVPPSWDTDGQVCVQQTDPLPVTLVSTTVEVSVGGG